MSNYVVSNTDMTSVANKIRSKTGGSAGLVWPNGFISAIDGITPSSPVIQTYEYEYNIAQSYTIDMQKFVRVETFTNLYETLRSSANLPNDALIQITKVWMPVGNGICTMRIYGADNISLYVMNTNTAGGAITNPANTKVKIQFQA